MKIVLHLLLALLFTSNLHAAIIELETQDVTKYGNQFHLKLNGMELLSVDHGKLTIDTNTGQASYQVSLTGGWHLLLNMTVSPGFSGTEQPRCTNNLPCDTSDWLHLDEDNSRFSRLMRDNERYMLREGWGQFGMNAGGVNVTPTDNLAFAFWFKDWRYQERAAVGAQWQTLSDGVGGDTNSAATTSVPEPNPLLLIAIAILLLVVVRKKRAII